jgi:hypothetical protein
VDRKEQDVRGLVEEAARLVRQGITPTLILEARATGAEERKLPGTEPLLPLLRPLAHEAWREVKEEGKRPFKVEVILDLHRGELAVEVVTVSPLEVKRWSLPSPFAQEARRVLGLMHIADF